VLDLNTSDVLIITGKPSTRGCGFTRAGEHEFHPFLQDAENKGESGSS
jgi:hypothetical protein